MGWKRILTYDDKPNYYKPVKIIADGKVHNDWHRLSDGDSEYYGSLNTNLIIDGDTVTHWDKLDGQKRSVLIEKIPSNE